MKKNNFVFVFILTFLFFISCSSNDDNDEIPTTPPPVNNVTYTNGVSTIINGSCLNCHGNPTANGAPISLTTFNEVKTAAQNKNLIGRIENGTMPPNGNLSNSQIETINSWKNTGYIE